MALVANTVTPSMELAKSRCEQPTMECPFEAMHLGEKQMQMYISDVKDRLKDRNWVRGSYEQKVRQLQDAMPAPRRDQVQKTQRKIKGEFRDMLTPLRGNIYDLAKTVYELYNMLLQQQEQTDTPTLTESVKDCADHMNDTFTLVKDDMKILHEKSLGMIKTMDGQILSQAWWAACWMTFHQFMAIFCLSLQVLLCILLMRSSHVAKVESTGVRRMLDCISDVMNHLVWQRQAPQDANSLLVASIAGASCLPTVFLVRSLYKVSTQDRLQNGLAATHAAQANFLEVSQDMLSAVGATIQDLEREIKVYGKIKDGNRTDRRADCIMEVARKLFAMSMAIDEYIVWLSLNDYFSPNQSIRTWIGSKRYDLIKLSYENAASPILHPSSTDTAEDHMPQRMEEPRRQAVDGSWYTREEFMQFYGQRKGDQMWKRSLEVEMVVSPADSVSQAGFATDVSHVPRAASASSWVQVAEHR